MNTVLIPPPERDRPRDHARRRSELVAIVAATKPVRVRRALTPVLAAASAVAVTIGVTIALPVLRDLEPAGSPSLPMPPDSADGSSADPPLNAPASVRDLTLQQQFSFWESCHREFDNPGNTARAEKFADYKSLAGLTFVGEHRIGVPASWLITRNGDQYWICIKDGRGNIIGDMGFGPRTVKDTQYLFHPVDQRGQGAGPYTAPVARVTVQPRGGDERDAALRHGFWFVPLEEIARRPHLTSPHAGQYHGSTDAPANHTIRGYDARGNLVYDSSSKEANTLKCYADPDGREIITGGTKDTPPETCARTLRWRP